MCIFCEYTVKDLVILKKYLYIRIIYDNIHFDGAVS